MCGFIACTTTSPNNFFIQKRGPDLTTRVKVHDFQFIHNLLSVTGEFTPQPFIEGEIVCLFNGEIYNQPFERTDGENLIPLYRKHGVDFVREIDGEFALALYDFANGLAIFATDPFGTKPLWRKGAEVASYRSGIGGERVPPNTRVVVELRSGSVSQSRVVEFEFNNQHKQSYDDWIQAFEDAVRKRAKPRCFIGLSSGYDSGAIHCILKKLKIPFREYSIRGRENLDVLMCRGGTQDFVDISDDVIARVLADVRENTESYDYDVTIGGQRFTASMLDDPAVVGIGSICRLARAEGRRVLLSGQGADEILSDYALLPSWSELGGQFPEALHAWSNFADNFQTAFLTKEEYVCGTFGIEARYPFLDRRVVQEFLWLSAALKNRHYKAPIHELFLRYDYPFEAQVKRGFSIREGGNRFWPST